jgi:hypothetical protein
MQIYDTPKPVGHGQVACGSISEHCLPWVVLLSLAPKDRDLALLAQAARHPLPHHVHHLCISACALTAARPKPPEIHLPHAEAWRLELITQMAVKRHLVLGNHVVHAYRHRRHLPCIRRPSFPTSSSSSLFGSHTNAPCSCMHGKSMGDD